MVRVHPVRIVKIGVDVDGVLADLHTPWVKWIQQNVKSDFTLDQWTDFDIGKTLGPKAMDYLNDPNVFTDCGEMPNAYLGLKYLVDRGDQVFIVSNIPAVVMLPRTAWLLARFPFLEAGNFIFTGHKSLLKLDMLIDDYPTYLKNFSGIRVLFDRPYNKLAPADTHDFRMYGWLSASMLKLPRKAA